MGSISISGASQGFDWSKYTLTTNNGLFNFGQNQRKSIFSVNGEGFLDEVFIKPTYAGVTGTMELYISIDGNESKLYMAMNGADILGMCFKGRTNSSGQVVEYLDGSVSGVREIRNGNVGNKILLRDDYLGSYIKENGSLFFKKNMKIDVAIVGGNSTMSIATAIKGGIKLD